MTSAFQAQYGTLALVTGASSGIGEAFARALAAKGLNLLLVARREDRLLALQAELQSGDVQVDILVADLSQADSVNAIVAALKDRDLGLLIANAGFGLKGPFLGDDIARIDAMINVNARSPVQLIHALLPAMKAKQRGGIIITGSQEGESPYPWSSAYAATKAFVHSFGLSLYGELRGTGVDVLVLAPGSTDTDAPAKQGVDMSQMPRFMVMSPAAVAGQALQQLGKRPLFISGWTTRLMVGLMRCLPRRWAIAAAGKGMASALENSGKPVKP